MSLVFGAMPRGSVKVTALSLMLAMEAGPVPPSAEATIGPALPGDLPAIVAVLAEDDLGGHGDAWDDDRAPSYQAAFAAIMASTHLELFVARQNGRVVAYGQIGFSDMIVDRGARKCDLIALFVAKGARSGGIGARMVAHAEARARARGAVFMTLSSNKRRLDAHRFYRTLGYEQRREGFAKRLDTV